MRIPGRESRPAFFRSRRSNCSGNTVGQICVGGRQSRLYGKSERAAMCRNIRTLFNFEPPATDEEVRAASLQFVRKVSGFNAPSRANEAAFERAVEEVAAVARRLVDDLVTTAAPRNREEVSALARARYVKRFGRSA